MQTAEATQATASTNSTFESHWPEYAMEAAELGIFMLVACICGVMLEHPESPVYQAFENDFARRVLFALAMGLTAIALFTSPWGQRSGAHMNPGVTLTFYLLGKIRLWDAVFYVAAQFAGAVAGVGVASLLLGLPLRNGAVNYVATQPGRWGIAAALMAEFAIAFGMMSLVLILSNSQRWHSWTPYAAGALVAIYITFEAPVSGMSLNPARTFGSAWFAGDLSSVWLYFVGPPAGMLAASAAYRFFSLRRVYCAKMNHTYSARCIFRCGYNELISGETKCRIVTT